MERWSRLSAVIACTGLMAGATMVTSPSVVQAATPAGHAASVVRAEVAGSAVLNFGDAPNAGSLAGTNVNQSTMGMASTPTGRGYWLVAADGGIFSFGDAGFYGSTGGMHINQPVVGMAAPSSGAGYWLVASDGGVFAFGGGAPFYGSAGGMHINQPVVGMASTPTGRGYWLAAADGGIFTFGNAPFEGSAAGHQLNQPVIGIAAVPDGGGYWMVEGQRSTQSPFTPALVSAILSRPGVVSAAVLDINKGRMYQYRPFSDITASIVKVDILETLLHQAQQAGRSLSGAEQVTATSMIEQSDNNSASALYADVGGPGPVTAYDRAAGMNSTFPNAAWGLTTTTAADQVDLVDHLAEPNGLLSDTSRAYAVNLMERVTPSQAWGVSGGVGPGATVALKNGWLPVSSGWAVNSIGWIHGSGRNYILAVLTADQPTEQTGIDTISQVAATAWTTLAG